MKLETKALNFYFNTGYFRTVAIFAKDSEVMFLHLAIFECSFWGVIRATPASGKTNREPADVTVAMVTHPTSLAGKIVLLHGNGRMDEGDGSVSTSYAEPEVAG